MRFPHLFYIIKAKCGRRCAVFAIFARQFFLQTASIRREAVTALQIIDALHVVGSQREVEDVDDGHLVAAIQFHGLGLEVKRVCHTECDAVYVADRDFLRCAIGLVNLGLLALYIQASRAKQGEGC